MVVSMTLTIPGEEYPRRASLLTNFGEFRYSSSLQSETRFAASLLGVLEELYEGQKVDQHQQHRSSPSRCC